MSECESFTKIFLGPKLLRLIEMSIQRQECPTICICSHDAGGAEILSSYVQQYGLKPIYALEGPALKIFQRKLGAINNQTLAEAINESDELLCGTSWQSDLEWRAIGLARKQKKNTAAFLDHWVNYRERFIRNSQEHLPDQIWVGDLDGEKIAREIFNNTNIKVLPNPYFEEIRLQLQTLVSVYEESQGLRVLYVCEPIREHALKEYGNERFWGYTEEEALRYFLSNVSKLNRAISEIVIRPHPSESYEKYIWAIKEFADLPIRQGGQSTLLQEIVVCDMVVGCESMALVVGLLAERRVISTIPPGGKPLSLPQRGIESFTELTQTK